MKNILYGKKEHNRTRTSSSMYTQNTCTHSRKHERVVTSKWYHSVGSFTPYPFQSWYDVGKGWHTSHAARSTHVILVTNKRRTLQWCAQSMDLNPSKFVSQCACTAAATKSQGAHACYSSDVPLYNSYFTDTLYHGEQIIIHCCNCHSRWIYNVLKRN